MTPLTTGTGSRLAPALDQKLADTGQPLFDVASWYLKAYLATRSIKESDLSDNESAALSFGIEEFESEAEIGTRPCKCMRPDPNVCRCWETLKAARAALARVSEPIPEPVPDHDNSDGPKFTQELAERALPAMAREAMRARGDKVIPQHIDPWSAMLFLAPLGNELAQTLLAWMLKPWLDYDATPLAENIFQDRRYVTLLYAAFAAHRDYTDCDLAQIIRRWLELGIAAIESAHLVEWFCATRSMQVLRIERDLKIKLGKQGWHV
jgi:hypothetical protein